MKTSPIVGNLAVASRERVIAVKQEIARTFIGKGENVDLLLAGVFARGHVLLEGVPGIAKTTLMKCFATALGCSQKRIQFTPDLLPADITGSYVFSPRDGTFSLRPGPIFANVILADEVNRAPAKTQAAMLEAMQERQVTIEGNRFDLPSPFFVVATQNPSDLEGTYPLPEAQLDRFILRIAMGYPSAADELRMLMTHATAAPEPAAVLSLDELRAIQSAASQVFIEPDLMAYAVALASYTRNHRAVVLGASPRATLGLVNLSKAWALLQGRSHVTPDDLREMLVPALAHRMVVEDDRAQAKKVLAEAVQKTSYRREAKAL
jgi:MoxR-like ATPase